MPPQSGAPGFSLSPSVFPPFHGCLSSTLLPSARTHYFLPPRMPKMPPAVRKCQMFTTLLTKYAHSHTQGTRASSACMCRCTLTCRQRHMCPHPLDTQHSGGNLISRRVYGIDFCFSLVLVGYGLAESGSC